MRPLYNILILLQTIMFSNLKVFKVIVNFFVFDIFGQSATFFTILSPDLLLRQVGTLAPVINLSTEYASTLIGTGTMTDPYRAE